MKHYFKVWFCIVYCCVFQAIGIDAALLLENGSDRGMSVSSASPESRSFNIDNVAIALVGRAQNNNSSFSIDFITDLVPELATVLSLDKPLRNYPNPFSFSSQSTTIGFSLSKAAEVTLHIYSLMGYKLYSKDFSSGSDIYNRITINKDILSPVILSPGVYLYILESNGEILGKNKMAVTP